MMGIHTKKMSTRAIEMEVYGEPPDVSDPIIQVEVGSMPPPFKNIAIIIVMILGA